MARFVFVCGAMTQKTWLALAALAATLVAVPAAAQTQRYTITDLGSLYGCCTSEDEAYATGINNAGDVVGSALVPGNPDRPRPFLYRNGHMTAITSTVGYATAINNAGNVVGYIERPDHILSDAFLWDGTLHNLGGLPRHSADGYALAWALNNTGVIVGVAGGFAAGDAAMVYVNDHMFSFNYRGATIAYGVNDAGTIVGLMSDGVGTLNHAFLVNLRGFRDLGTLDHDPAGVSIAYAINASGVVVGTSWVAGNSSQRAFAYSNGAMRDLGVLTGGMITIPAGWEYAAAFAINTAGDIVGESSGHAFLHHAGTMQDLNAAVDHDENGWPRLQIATGINDRGQIVGNAYFGDRPGLRPFLLTPVQTPQP